jgi:hypothetical protein
MVQRRDHRFTRIGQFARDRGKSANDDQKALKIATFEVTLGRRELEGG